MPTNGFDYSYSYDKEENARRRAWRRHYENMSLSSSKMFTVMERRNRGHSWPPK